MSTDPNPYLTPADVHPVVTRRRMKASPKLRLAFICAATAYLVFTAMLLTSTPVDQRYGALFVWNLPIVATMSLAGFWSKTLAGSSAIVAASVQIVFAVLSRYLAFGGDITGTVVITTPFVLALLGLGLLALKPAASAEQSCDSHELGHGDQR
tara:strand:+ start:92 stop:550 length:459 start_codon:yes stop_codon:yes gene_type:complete